ncbi:YgiL family fimbrial-like protein [Trabulsiella guamensis ATCC 49490]|uniref:YgiL family fimbrial-like protein n=1 Tax=Trabulsiella guamensis ATCC 49490 TaxID=1005994 RepID=A0A084ZNY4_9ENTR|nr:YgiL family fimbrial-like protein [Trabulsiella guamensis ATCC 49490]
MTFSGWVIESPCSIQPGDEDLQVDLGEVATSVLNSEKMSLATDFTIHLQDCILSKEVDGQTVTTNKVDVTFSSANVNATDSSLMKNSAEDNEGGATNVGVRILDDGNEKITLGEAVAINFPNLNSYQELNFKARMEKTPDATGDATPGNVNAIANYILNYE